MPSHLLLWPIFLYVGAALLLPRLTPILGPSARMLGTLLATVLAFLATVLISHRASTAADALSWRLSDWAGLDGPGLILRADPFAIAAMLLIGLVGMAVYLGTLDDKPVVMNEEYHAGLLLILAGLMGMALSANLLTLLITGLVMDIGVFYGIGLTGRTRWVLAAMFQSLAATTLLIGAALLLWNESGVSTFEQLGGRAATLTLLALAIRLAPLPLTLYPIAIEALPPRVRAILPMLTLVAGGILVGRLTPLVEGALPAVLMPLTAVAVIGVALSGWVAWRSQDRTMRLAMLAAGQGAWALWAACAGLPSLAVGIAWGAVPALAVLALTTERLTFRTITQLPALIAGVVLLGIPGSALWNAITVLGGQSWSQGNSWYLTLAAVGLMTSTVAVIELLASGDDQRPVLSRLIGVGLLAILSVPLFAVLWGLQLPAMGSPIVVTAPMWAQLALPLIAWAGGWWLWRARPWTQPLSPILDTVGSAFSFAWLWRLIGRVGWVALTLFQGGMRVLEGENYGWLLFFLFVTVIYFLQGYRIN